MGEHFDACKGPNGPSLRRRWNNFKFNFKSGIDDLKSDIKKTYEKIMPDKIVKKIEEPIWTKAESTDPLIEPENPSIFPQTKEDICNKYGIYEGLQYPEFEKVEDKLKVKTDLDVKASNVPGTLSGLSLLMNANNESTLKLSDKAQDFGIGFEIVNAYKGPRSENTVSEEEFLLFLENYAKDANSEKEAGDDARKRLAVHFDEENQEELKKAFKAIAGEDNLITKKEFEAFWNEILANGEKIIDPVTGFELTKITGEDLNNAINQALEEIGELPTFRKTPEEIKYLEKEKELQDLKVNVDPNLVEKIEYSKDKMVAFVTLDDGTELQFSKESHYGENTETASSHYEAGSLNITKEDDRYVITNVLASDVRGEEYLKVVPSESSKITIRGGSHVVYSSPDNLNDDVVIEGDVKNIKLIVGTGEDNIVNNQENTRRDNTADVVIVKDVTNTTVKLEDKNDIAYTHVLRTKNDNRYYSARTTDIKKLQKEDLDKFIARLEKASDEELLRAILKDKTDKDINNLTNQELLELANENGFEIAGNGDDFSLTQKQRKNFLKNYRNEQIDHFKEINKEGRKEEKPLKKTTESNP